MCLLENVEQLQETRKIRKRKDEIHKHALDYQIIVNISVHWTFLTFLCLVRENK